MDSLRSSIVNGHDDTADLELMGNTPAERRGAHSTGRFCCTGWPILNSVQGGCGAPEKVVVPRLFPTLRAHLDKVKVCHPHTRSTHLSERALALSVTAGYKDFGFFCDGAHTFGVRGQPREQRANPGCKLCARFAFAQQEEMKGIASD